MAKYKFTLTSDMRTRVGWDLEYYPEDKKQLEELKNDMIPSAIPKYGPQTGGFNPEQRPTEDTATRIVSDRYIQWLSWKVNAIESVLAHLSDTDLELIRLRYWSGDLTPDGIAMKLNIGRTTVFERLNNILVEIARRLGYINL